jgi:putative inorganic carbon (HCO3(-)) transporter
MDSSRPSPDRHLFLAFCLLIVWAPIPLGSNRVWAMQLLQVWIALITVGLCWQIGQGRLEPAPALKKSWFPVSVLFGISLWTIIQLLPPPLSPLEAAYKNQTSGYLALQKSMAYTLMFLCALQLLSTPQRLERVAHVIVLSGVIQAVYAVLVNLGGPSFDLLGLKLISPYKDANTGTFVNRNHLAGYLEMCLAAGIGLLMARLESGHSGMGWRERSRRLLRALLGGKARVRLFLVVMVIALVMTHSRMGNSAFFASMGISALIGVVIYRKVSRSLVILFASMIAIDVFIISAWFGLDKLATRIEQTRLSEEVRLDVNANAWPWFQEHWLSGSGAGSFGSQFPAYRTADVGPFFDFAHNDYLQILGEYGAIGALFFALMVISSLWAAITAQRQRQNQVLRGMAFAAMMGVTSLMIHASVDFNHYIPANAMLFTLLCAFAWAARFMDSTQQKRRRA